MYFEIILDFPEFTALPLQVQSIVQRNTFTFNCTPSAANPPPSSYVFERDGVDITEGASGSILTISSLKRSKDSGNYTCVVTNEAGSVTIATNVNVLGEQCIYRISGYECESKRLRIMGLSKHCG